MADYVESPLLGKSQIPSPLQEKLLAEAAHQMPLALFQALNKALNQRGLCLRIASLPQEKGKS